MARKRVKPFQCENCGGIIRLHDYQARGMCYVCYQRWKQCGTPKRAKAYRDYQREYHRQYRAGGRDTWLNKQKAS